MSAMFSPDPSQQEFCEAPVGNIRLLAPAGCGKTMSLLFRCLNLYNLASGTRPRFLIVTFTVAARHELASRINSASRFAKLRDQLDVTTLNAWGFRRLKSISFNPKLISTKPDFHFAMLNQLQPVWEMHEAVQASIKANRNTTPRKILSVMDNFKSLGFDHQRHTNYEKFQAHIVELRRQSLDKNLSEAVDSLTKVKILDSVTTRRGDERATQSDRNLYNKFFQFWRDATKQLISNSTFTLEDQKYVAYLDELEKIEEGKFLSGITRYDHVLVDEFQDINPLDLNLIKTITTRNRASLTVIGDDDQAIYEWRGATPEYILNPDRFFGVPFQTFTLKTNYRSPRNVVEASQRLIRHNSRRVDKDISADRHEDAVVEIRRVEELAEAMEAVYQIVQESISLGDSPSRVAIMGRKRSQLIPYQIFFASKQVPFCAAEDLQVFMSGAFDKIIEFLTIKIRSATRQSRSQVVDDILTMCDSVKRYPLNKSEKTALKQYMSVGTFTKHTLGLIHLNGYTGSLKGPNTNRAISISMAQAIDAFLATSTVHRALLTMSELFEGLQADIGKAEDDIFYVDPPFLYLAEYAKRYEDDFDTFVDDIEQAKSHLTFIPPFDEESGAFDELWKRPVHLMTALRAKGKEFDTVIILDANDGIWPSKNAKSPDEREAERRVFYVAFTRAKKQVVMLVTRKLDGKPLDRTPYISELGIEWPYPEDPKSLTLDEQLYAELLAEI